MVEESSKEWDDWLGILVGNLIDLICNISTFRGLTNEASGFTTNNLPQIDVVSYADRLAFYTRCSPDAICVATSLVLRLHFHFPSLVCHNSAHRILAAAFVVAAKFEDDTVQTNHHFALCAGVEIDEMNRLEICLLSRLSFAVFVHPDLTQWIRRQLIHANKINSDFLVSPNPDLIVADFLATFSHPSWFLPTTASS